MKAKIKKTDFRFRPYGYGHYYVTYFSPITGKEYTCCTNDMPLIDLTRNNEDPRVKDLTELKRICKAG
jgi:hypothetical protein